MRMLTIFLALISLCACGGNAAFIPQAAVSLAQNAATATSQADTSAVAATTDFADATVRGPVAPTVPTGSSGTSALAVKLVAVAPSAANSAIDPNYDKPNLVAPPLGRAMNRLFVFLSGTGGVPSAYQAILREASARGFHAIGLEYVNGTAVASYCGGRDAACWGNVRNAIITGAKSSSLITVAPQDSIVNRLSDLLAYLAAKQPAQGWGQYRNANGIVWNKVAVGGHSQGGGHAAYIGKLYATSRLCYFDSPADDLSASWYAMPNVTPGANQYGFTNQADQIAAFSTVTAVWNKLGLGGKAVNVDAVPPPYQHLHELYTNVSNSDAVGSHTYTSADNTPTKNGVPTYTPVWDYVCFS